MSEVTAVDVSFLWHPYFPLGKLTMIDGDPGQGKSTVTLAMATAGSLGRGLPGVAAFDPWRTLVFTMEDGAADTIKPRLEAMGADCSWIRGHALQPLDLSTAAGREEIDREIQEFKPQLVVVDPISAYVGAKTDMYRANEVRAVMAPLAALAEQHDCAIVAIRHLTKQKGGRSIYAGAGSIDFVGAARSVLLVGSAPTNPAEKALVHIKHNLTVEGPSVGFMVHPPDSPAQRFGRFEWTGTSSLTAGDVLAAEPTGGERSAASEARAFLLETLADGPVDAKQVKADAKIAGISLRTLERAKREEGIVAVRRGFGAAGSWWWSLKDRQETP